MIFSPCPSKSVFNFCTVICIYTLARCPQHSFLPPGQPQFQPQIFQVSLKCYNASFTLWFSPSENHSLILSLMCKINSPLAGPHRISLQFAPAWAQLPGEWRSNLGCQVHTGSEPGSVLPVGCHVSFCSSQGRESSQRGGRKEKKGCSNPWPRRNEHLQLPLISSK